MPDATSAALTVFRRTDFSYDGRRNLVREAASQSGTTFSVFDRSHDGQGRAICQAQRMNPALFPVHGAGGALPADACAPSTPAGGHGPDRITRNIHDAAGQRLQLREGVSTAIEAAEATWDYNLNGQIVTVIDGNGNRAELRYDGHMRQDRWTFPSTTRPAAYDDATPATALATAGNINTADFEDYGYDAAGNRISLRKRDGRRIAFAYDNLNRVTAKTYPDDGATAVHYSYDLRGLQLSARFGSQSGEGITSSYDGFGRLATSTTNMGGTTRTLQYRYDSADNRTRITHPDGAFFDTAYDALGRPISISDPLSPRVLVSYTAHGGPGFVLRNNATQTIYGYGPLQRLGSIAMGRDFPGYTEDLFILMDRNPPGRYRPCRAAMTLMPGPAPTASTAPTRPTGSTSTARPGRRASPTMRTATSRAMARTRSRTMLRTGWSVAPAG